MKHVFPLNVLLIIASSVGLLALSTPTAHAQRIGTGDEPIYISSDTFEGTEQRGIWSGNVRIVQGKAILVAERVVGDLDSNGGITVVTGTGNVRYSDGEQAISGTKGVYNEKARTLTINGDVIVTQGRNVFTANQAVYWIDTGRVIFTPRQGERVRGIFYPSTDIKTPS